MAMMKVEAIKYTKDVSSFKIVYEKNGTLFMRTGMDTFQKGRRVPVPLNTLINKHGFRRVEDAPSFRDAGDIIDNLNRFQMSTDGTLSYH